MVTNYQLNCLDQFKKLYKIEIPIKLVASIIVIEILTSSLMLYIPPRQSTQTIILYSQRESQLHLADVLPSFGRVLVQKYCVSPATRLCLQDRTWICNRHGYFEHTFARVLVYPFTRHLYDLQRPVLAGSSIKIPL